jgi:hypothetical protein
VTAAQATIEFLKNQYVERDGVEHRFFAGCFGIFGQGNVAGIGQALQQNPDLSYYLSRNEQAMMLYRRGLLQDEQPPARVRLHVLHRSERDEHGNWGRHSPCEPNPCVSASRRYFRAAQRRTGSATGVATDSGYFRERLLQAGFSLLGPYFSA